MKGAGSIAIANMLGRVTGMLREMVVSAVFGAGMVTDAFNAAIRVPQLLRELLAEGSLQNAWVPAFAEAFERRGAADAWRLANAFLGVLLLALGGTTLMFFAAAPFWVHLVAGGYAADADKYTLTVTLTRWLSPFIAGLSLAGFAAAMLNVRGRFFLPAIATNLLNLLVIAGCLLSDRFEALTGLPPIVAVAIATTLSGFSQLALTWPALRAEGFRVAPTLGGHPGLRRMLATLGPAIIGISTVQFNLLVETGWASSYGDGALTYLSLAFRLVQLPLAVVAGSVATAALASLSARAARGDEAGVGDELTRALRVNATLVIPSAVALGVLARPLCELFFERGAFSAADTAGTAAMLQMYALAVYGICFHRVAVPVYYALGDPRTPMRLSIGAMLAKVPVILLLTRGFGLGVEALPLSHALTVSGECVLLGWGLRDRVRGRGLLRAHLAIGIAALVLGAAAFALNGTMHVVLVCAIAGGLYLAAARALGIRDFGLPGGRGLPPGVDAASGAALGLLAGGDVHVEGTRIACPGGSWRMIAEDGRLRLHPEGEPVRGALGGPVSAVLRPGAPPTLRGIQIGARTWHADGGVIVEGDCPGPRLPLARG